MRAKQLNIPRLLVVAVVLYMTYQAGVLGVLAVLAVPVLVVRGYWLMGQDMSRIGRAKR